MLSPDGACHTFDDKANGFVPGEAVGVVILKKLEQAVADKIISAGSLKDGALTRMGQPTVLLRQVRALKPGYKRGFMINSIFALQPLVIWKLTEQEPNWEIQLKRRP